MGRLDHYGWKDSHYHLINKEVYVTVLHGDQGLVHRVCTPAFSICLHADCVIEPSNTSDIAQIAFH